MYKRRFPSLSYGPGAYFGKETALHNNTKKIANFRVSNWLIALLFIFALSISGLGISIFTGSFIPFWILLGFSTDPTLLFLPQN
jgi:hypothetical protein